jgi:hypothetical protein
VIRATAAADLFIPGPLIIPATPTPAQRSRYITPINISSVSRSVSLGMFLGL